MNQFYKKITLISVFLILGSIIGYFFIFPFIINNILIPIQAYKSHSIFNEIENRNEIDEDYTYFDNSGNVITIWDFKKNIPDIEKSFFKENLLGELFYESTDSKKDKFEFKIVEFNKIDTLQYKLRVRKVKIQEENQINLNNRKYLNYFFELELINNKLKIKKCILTNIEVD